MAHVVNVRTTSEFDVYVGRHPDPVKGKWGNPFSHLPNTLANFKVRTREEAIEKYREWIYTQPQLLEDAKKELKGKILACWCSPQPCHGDILLTIANSEW